MPYPFHSTHTHPPTHRVERVAEVEVEGDSARRRGPTPTPLHKLDQLVQPLRPVHNRHAPAVTLPQQAHDPADIGVVRLRHARQRRLVLDGQATRVPAALVFAQRPQAQAHRLLR